MVKVVDRGDPVEPAYLTNMLMGIKGWGVISGLAVAEKAAGPDMSVDVAIGEAVINVTAVSKSSTTNVAITAADADFDRYDLVVINSSGTVSVIDGTAAAESYANDYDFEANNAILLAEVLVPAADTTIEDAQITDKRAFIVSGTDDLTDVSGSRSLATEYTNSSVKALRVIYSGSMIIANNAAQQHVISAVFIGASTASITTAIGSSSQNGGASGAAGTDVPHSITFYVPAGWKYQITQTVAVAAGGIKEWWEMTVD